MDKILVLDSINAGYNNKTILRNINLTVKYDDFIGVIGPNGGGKTTLLKVILKLLKPFSGKINYYENGTTVKLMNIGYLPQVNPLDKVFPIAINEVVLSGLMGQKQIFHKFTKEEKEKADEVMNLVGIMDLKNKNAGEVSGGQLQKALLSRAIISSPKLLILDEPSTYVDSSFEHDLYQILLELNKRMAIIIVSHDIGTISTYIKSIACVNQGLHYHASNTISEKTLKTYGCPIDLITHGDIPHRVLPKHPNS